MDLLTADDLSSVLEHLSLKSIHHVAEVCQQLRAASKAKVKEMSALESFRIIERTPARPLRNALRRPCFVEFCGPLLAVTNRWDVRGWALEHTTPHRRLLHQLTPTAFRGQIGRVHLINVETPCVETSCGSFGVNRAAEETDQELNEPRGLSYEGGSGTLYVVDAKNARLRPLVGGSFCEGWDLEGSGLGGPLVAQDVAVLPDRRLCITRAFDKQARRPSIDQCLIVKPAPPSKERGSAEASAEAPLSPLSFGPYGTTGG